jgi:DNA polymerase-3 subunit delta
MRLRANQIKVSIEKKLAPVYLISGDEPLQLGETADTVRQTAKKFGYENREIFTVDASFNWNGFLESAGSLSLFADKKIIDLRIPSGKPGKEGAKAIVKYCERPPEDTLLLITAGKIAKASEKTAWFQALDKGGVVVQVWPLDGRDLMQWVQQRMQQKGLQADQAVFRLLTSRIEGNLLAAAQEIEKLYILFGSEKRLTEQDILDAVADSSRYDVFKLVDSALAGQTQRTHRILQGLKAEGVAEPVILWALSREARTLVKIKDLMAQGERRDSAYKKNQVWGNRQKLLDAALKRLSYQHLEKILLSAAIADCQIKGEAIGDVWVTFMDICLVFSGIQDILEKSVSHNF